MATLFVDKLDPQSGTALEIGTSGDTVTIPTGVTVAGSMANTPAFFVYRTGSQDTISSETWTKVQLNTEEYDTASAFDNSSNYRFTVPSGEGGKYFFQASVFGNAGDNNLQRLHIRLYKNGSTILTIAENDWTNQAYRNSQMYSASGVLDLNAADYIELYVKAWIGSGTLSVNPGGGANESPTRLIGYKLIGA